MKAVWYERQGPAQDVLVVGTMDDPLPGPGEVRIRVKASGINPGDLNKRQGAFGFGMPFSRVVPHSDGAGVIDEVGSGVPTLRLGESVWCYGAQSYRPFGTAAEYVVVPAGQAVALPEGISFEQGAFLGIPSISAHRGVHSTGPIDRRTVLIQGAAGAVGCCAVGLARRAGAWVLATVRSETDAAHASRAGAHEVLRTDGRSTSDIVAAVRALAPDGVDHVVEVAFDANIGVDTEPPGGRSLPMPESTWPRRFRSDRCPSRTSACISSAATTSRPRPGTSRHVRSMRCSGQAGPASRSSGAFRSSMRRTPTSTWSDAGGVVAWC